MVSVGVNKHIEPLDGECGCQQTYRAALMVSVDVNKHTEPRGGE